MELVFLGTGAATPSRKRTVASLALRFDLGSEAWLFDCGEGTQHHMLNSPVSPAQITHIFITHLHGDHIYGLPGLLATRSLQGVEQPLAIIGPAGIKQFLTHCLELSYTKLRFPINIIELSEDGIPTDDPSHVSELLTFRSRQQRFIAKILPLAHGIPSFGYFFQELPPSGQFKADLARRLGIPEGPLYGLLKRGEDVTLSDGRVIHGSDMTESAKPGRRIVVFGDTRPCPTVLPSIAKADVMVHEATFAEEHHDLAEKSGHSTVTQAARLAAAAQVQTLILTHISPRYQPTSHDPEADPLLLEAKAIFPATLLAYDGMVYRF